jgi:AraC-like DNA-binding protein
MTKLHIIWPVAILPLMLMLLSACTGKGSFPDDEFGERADDTLYTRQAAMSIYAYQPERALQIIDTAVIVGNLSEWEADMLRTRIYGSSVMRDQLDSLLGGPKDVRLDSARAIGERLLGHDSIKADLSRQQNVLEMLVNTARMKADTTGWLQRSREYIDVCHKLGADSETDALRTEAEIGAALYHLGQHEQGMAKLDSMIFRLNEKPSFKFNELDALIIALKRKIVILGSHDKYAETLPLARRIIERLDDYEQHPDAYHDGSTREPKDSVKRADYIRFYRSQAQNFITAAYASLGESGNMLDAFENIERSVSEVTAREHIARYNALQQQMEAERLQVQANRANMIIVAVAFLALVFLAFALVVIFKNRAISRKNRLLVQQIGETMSYKDMYWEERLSQAPMNNPDINTLNDDQLFQYINEVIVREKLFLNPKFERQTIMDRFQLSKDRVGAIFSKGSNHAKMTGYIQQLRLEYGAKLLVERPDMSIVQIATESGFGSNTYFTERFRQYFSMTPSEFRMAASEQEKVELSSERV